MGQVAIRLMGDEEDIFEFVRRIEPLFGKLLIQGPRPNYKGDPGVRCYVTVTINDKGADPRAEEARASPDHQGHEPRGEEVIFK